MIAPDFIGLFEEEVTPVKQPKPIKNTPVKQPNTPDFFADLPDFFAGIELEQPAQEMKQPGFHEKPSRTPTPYDVPELSPEETKKMTYAQRLQYVKDLATEREYRQSKGITKGLLSGATLGFSEKIPGLAPEEGDFLAGFGEFVGSALPISKLYNILGAPLVKLAAKSPKYASALQSFARMTGFGITGAGYEGAKETIKTGEAPSPEELLNYGAQWAAFDGALQALR